jgi:hypothetical protein
MIGVLTLVIRPRQKSLSHRILASRMVPIRCSPKALELEEAKEILGEIFGIDVREVDEMIQRRMEERVLWPERFCVDP